MNTIGMVGRRVHPPSRSRDFSQLTGLALVFRMIRSRVPRVPSSDPVRRKGPFPPHGVRRRNPWHPTAKPGTKNASVSLLQSQGNAPESPSSRLAESGIVRAASWEGGARGRRRSIRGIGSSRRARDGGAAAGRGPLALRKRDEKDKDKERQRVRWHDGVVEPGAAAPAAGASVGDVLPAGRDRGGPAGAVRPE